MIIYPAIDLRGGHCVRLRQGSYEDETVYFDDPVKMAKLWRVQNAKTLHIVDLDAEIECDGIAKGQLTHEGRIAHVDGHRHRGHIAGNLFVLDDNPAWIIAEAGHAAAHGILLRAHHPRPRNNDQSNSNDQRQAEPNY